MSRHSQLFLNIENLQLLRESQEDNNFILLDFCIIISCLCNKNLFFQMQIWIVLLVEFHRIVIGLIHVVVELFLIGEIDVLGLFLVVGLFVAGGLFVGVKLFVVVGLFLTGLAVEMFIFQDFTYYICLVFMIINFFFFISILFKNQGKYEHFCAIKFSKMKFFYFDEIIFVLGINKNIFFNFSHKIKDKSIFLEYSKIEINT